ncbi:MAG TPA: shikimate dehydrogenase [Chitinophagaceae bacterium]|nr:shikimate dehydrogenase [Chitinophagaceae bacterium]
MRVFGLLGKTLKHSFSKKYFTEKFSALGLEDCRYENYELPGISALPELLANNPQLEGLNVTIPYKEDVLPYLNYSSDIVKEIKACNCIKIVDGKLHGHNTDVPGFKQSLEKHLKPHHSRALILGTGGAAKAVQYALKSLGIPYQYVSRFKKEDAIGYNEIDQYIFAVNNIIINTSPVGMYPQVNDEPPLPYQFITNKHLLFDLIYNPPKTKFLKKGEEKGASISNGEEMLVLQAEESWRIWNEL